jgi:hypothetical protein
MWHAGLSVCLDDTACNRMDEFRSEPSRRRTTMRAKNQGTRRWCGFLALGLLLAGCTGDVSGIVQARNPDGTLGDRIEDAALDFTREGEAETYRAISNANGDYEITLDRGRYLVDANHPDFVYLGEDPTYLVVEAGSNTANFFMEPR